MNDQKKVVILGGGVAGLSAGYCLARTGKYQVTILEAAAVTGGLCASFEHNGFTLDHGAHKLYSVIPGVLDEIVELMGDRLLKLEKRNRIYLNGHLLDYPLKITNLLKAFGFITFLKLGFGYAFSLAKGLVVRGEPKTYEEYMKKYFGAPAYHMVFEPLADKTWGEPSKLHPEMARTRVPASGGFEIILKLLGLKKETNETNAQYFYYPKKGFGDFPQKLKEEIVKLGGQVIVNARVEALDVQEHVIKKVSYTAADQRQPATSTVANAVNSQGASNNNSSTDSSSAVAHQSTCEIESDYVISTIPLPVLSRLLSTQEKNHLGDTLQFRHLLLVYIYVNRPMVLNDQWIFFPEKQFFFGRIFEQKQMNPDLGPEDRTVICCDLTCLEQSEAWQDSDETLAKKCIASLKVGGFISEEEVDGFYVKRQRNFYPRYDLDYTDRLQKVYKDLKSFRNLMLTGRLGMYNYNNSDHCYDMGKFLSEQLAQGFEPWDAWSALEERVKSYKIVD